MVNLTKRELDVWGLLQQGYSYEEMAARLSVSPETVKTHVKNVRAKLKIPQHQSVAAWLLTQQGRV